MLGYDELIEKIATFVELQQIIKNDELIEKQATKEVIKINQLPDYVRSREEHDNLRDQIQKKYLLRSKIAVVQAAIKRNKDRILSIKETLVNQLPENVLFMVPLEDDDYAVGVHIVNGPGRPNTKVLFFDTWKENLPPLKTKQI